MTWKKFIAEVIILKNWYYKPIYNRNNFENI